MLLIWIILAVTCLSLLLGLRQLTREKQKWKKRQHLLQAFQNAVAQHQLAIEFFNVVGHRIIGKDRRNGRLFFLDLNKKENQQACIPLNEVTGAKLVTERCAEGNIRRLVLVLQTAGNQSHALCFFDDAFDRIVRFPVLNRRARYWKSIVDRKTRPVFAATLPQAQMQVRLS